MIKEALAYLVSLKENKTYNIEGRHYSDKALELIEAPRFSPRAIEVYGLDSVCKLIRNEIDKVGRTIYVQATKHNRVDVFTTYNDRYQRWNLYTCEADVPRITTDYYMEYDKAAIELRSLYIPNDDSAYLLSLLSRITSENIVSSMDNGVTQRVEVRSGISLCSTETIKQRVNLRPFRTFLEVAQPESEFILRVNDEGRIAIIPADGGVWKLEAKKNIADYFEVNLKDLIEAGSAVVIR